MLLTPIKKNKEECIVTMEKIFKIARKMNWDVEEADNKVFFFKSYDRMVFKITVEKRDTVEEFLKELCKRERELDPSKEAYKWLDDTGHGKCGAPSEMGEVYKAASKFKADAWLLRDALIEVVDIKEFVLKSMKTIEKIAKEVLQDVQRDELSKKELKALDLLDEFVKAMKK